MDNEVPRAKSMFIFLLESYVLIYHKIAISNFLFRGTRKKILYIPQMPWLVQLQVKKYDKSKFQKSKVLTLALAVYCNLKHAKRLK